MNTVKPTIKELRDKGLVLLEYVTGSVMYGTNTPTSDRDVKGVYILPDDVITDYLYNEESAGEIKFETEEDGVKTEYTYYELKKFMNLIEKNNPNVLEVFDIPEDCLIFKHPIMDVLIHRQHKFITKLCANTFAGYAYDQIKKSKGQDKKQNWEAERFERKTIYDFCYVAAGWLGQGSRSLRDLIDEGKIRPESLALTKLPNMPFAYNLYIDSTETYATGISLDDKSTMPKTTTVPQGMLPAGVLTFNQMSWTQHCDEYRSYQTWLKERNEARWVDVKSHGQKIDGKNMLHMQRLVNMASDIASGKGIVTRRPEAQDLLKIRKGEVPLQELLDNAEASIKGMQDAFKTANLPDKVERSVARDVYGYMRSKFFSKVESI